MKDIKQQSALATPQSEAMSVESALDDLTTRLTRLYLAAARDVATAILRNGRGVTVGLEEIFIERESPDSWQSASRLVERNVLDSQFPPQWGREYAVLSDEIADEALKIAGAISTMEGARLPFFAPMSHDVLVPRRTTQFPSYEEDPADWTRTNLLLPALYAHLEILPSLRAASEHHADVFAQEVLTFTKSSEMTYRTVAPLAGIQLGAQTEIALSNGVKLRRLTPNEERNLAEEQIKDPYSVSSLPLCALEVDQVTGRLETNPDIRPTVETWLNAIQLQGHRIAGKRATSHLTPEWSGFGTMYFPLNLRRSTQKWSTVTEKDAVEIARIAGESQKYDLTQKKTATHALALHRYHLGMAKESDVESLLDFVISLEAILLPRDSQVGHSDLSYRFKVHGAHYLASTTDERHEIYKRMGNLYTLRSVLVHGGKYPDAATISTAQSDAEGFARKALNRALRQGFPQAQTFIDLVLGEHSPAAPGDASA
ncbi:HEPN domain-containing protein [Streptomyces albidoflavus]|uniref:hypothetical protein n=1 Tax=Streptomyces albidoflavus TaxID=1886 RepID=UPI003873C6F1|nr:HEPN domain-containing protein [Streptomyces albidoflavus]